MPSRDYGRAGEQVRAPCDKTRLERKWLRRTTEYSKGLHRTHVVFVHLCSSLLWNLLLLGLGAGLGKCRQVQASGIVSMYGWMDVWRRAHLSTGASREAPVDNESFSTILTTSNPGISGLCTHKSTLAKLRHMSLGAMARSPLVNRCLARGTCGQ